MVRARLDKEELEAVAEDLHEALRRDPLAQAPPTQIAFALYQQGWTPEVALQVLHENAALRQGIQKIIDEGYSHAMEVTDALHYLLADTCK